MLHREHVGQDIPGEVIYRSGCDYALGRDLFLDLYDVLGDTAFRSGFGQLYLDLKDGVYDRECNGLDRGVCYVRKAFTVDASANDTFVANATIELWYSGTREDRVGR